MNDIISINRQFLIMAREASKSKSGEIMTGLSRNALDRIAQMTLDEIDAMARDIGISVISIRLTETEMDRLLSPRWPLQNPPLLATQNPPGRTR